MLTSYPPLGKIVGHQKKFAICTVLFSHPEKCSGAVDNRKPCHIYLRDYSIGSSSSQTLANISSCADSLG